MSVVLSEAFRSTYVVRAVGGLEVEVEVEVV
jgi:hypothetical protein